MTDSGRGHPSEAFRLFLERYPVALDREPERVVEDLARAFSRLPYENLTKIIRSEAYGRRPGARRMPQDVVRDHLSRGAGGTCFSLTGTLLHFFRSLGFAAEPVLADRRYGESTHCALLVRIDGENRLIDPGYLIARPLALQRNAETRRATAFNELVFRPRDGGEKLDLFTVAGERQVYRLTYRTAPADESEFLRAWDASFDWDMMRYPLLTCVRRGRQLYLQGTRYQRRGRADVEREDLAPADLAARIAREFAIDGEIVSRALRILERRGESHGGAVPS